ncbi:MAG: hypothetical protein PHH77_04315 [Victivallaceae bacterium]|nr:hypothetical protein [Victivallaceae bacterium]
MTIIGYALFFVVSSLFVGTALWLSMKMLKVEGTFPAMLIIAAVMTLVGFIPWGGKILSLITLYFMLHKWTTADFWPDAVLMTVCAGMIEFAVIFTLGLLLLKLGM